MSDGAPPRLPTIPVADIELPPELEKLYELAYNLWWTWNPEAIRLFAAIDGRAWAMYRNPVQLLINVEPRQWEPLLEGETFLASYRVVIAAFEEYLGREDTWMATAHGGGMRGPVAYFSMEYGLHDSLAIYSGGLGVLSGDHCKTASDLGVPFVALGLLYRMGYFRQTVDADGFQQHTYPEYDFSRLPVRPVASLSGRPVVVRVPFPGREIAARVWVAEIGRVPLLLLDTDIADNHAADRTLTHMLYVQGRETRLMQELLLGVGGVRCLKALGIRPAVFHVNEGHSALLTLERLRDEARNGLSLEEALRRLRRNTVFTAHTPVPAGHEHFDRELAAKYLAPWAQELALPLEELLRLGQVSDGDDSPFTLTAVAIRSASFVNGVSRLNAEVLTPAWGPLAEPAAEGAPVIQAITNGVHTASWMGLEISALLDRWLGRDWQVRPFDAEVWERLADVPDEELWRAHQEQKEGLFRFARARLREHFARHGRSPDDLRDIDEQFDPEILTIGFARRFATYKRANLLFTEMDRLQRILTGEGRPVQVLFAGKAHPADRPGQEIIQQIFQLSQSGALKGRVFFLEDYTLRIARALVQGVDLWLNTPRRPLEASGTSGQKAAINGALNLSALDGWWPEGFDGENGWAFGDGGGGDPEAQDRADAHDLYRILEEEVLPAYYERDEAGLPRAWIRRMKRSIVTIAPRFSSHRMVCDYVERAYLPAAARGVNAIEPVAVAPGEGSREGPAGGADGA